MARARPRSNTSLASIFRDLIEPESIPSRVENDLSGIIPIADDQDLQLPANQLDVDFVPAGIESSRQLSGRYLAPLNRWVAFGSTWIHMAKFATSDFETGSLYVEFLSLAVVRYDDILASQWSDLVQSESHGRWLYYTLADRGWPYTLLRYPSRKVTEAMKQANLNRGGW